VKPTAVASRYARALCEVIGRKDQPGLEKAAADLSLAAEVLHREPLLLKFFEDPSVPQQEKVRIVETLGKKLKAGERTRQFLMVLIENRRLAVLREIARLFAVLKDEILGVVPAEATTAVPLGAGEQKRLRASLETMTGRSVRLALNVDPAVLGGARTKIGSKVYDGTLKRRLAMLRERLSEAR
jgi:F-type H+-transporting ATPase subunit delta